MEGFGSADGFAANISAIIRFAISSRRIDTSLELSIPSGFHL
jgi:hypothetical protein